MKIAIIKENEPAETRVAVTPCLIKELLDMDLKVFVESKAGILSGFSDKDFEKAGAKIEKSSEKTLKNADIVLKVQAPTEKEINDMKKGSLLVGLIANNDNLIKKYAEQKISSFAMEFIPRITRAQSMDVLSSQSNLAGYKAVIDGVAEFHKVIPMMMTAAGTIRPAKVLVLGAGVAGLQAIATAKRLGAVVSAFDVRPDVKEQVLSLGANFVEVVNTGEDAETKGGYAKEMSKEYQKKQKALIYEHVKESDIIITTALIPRKPAPVLITENMVKDMKSGSIIVDLAVSNGGNCPLSDKNKIVTKHGVKIIGYTNLAGRVGNDASNLYARNLINFIKPMINTKLKKIKINFEDEIIQSCLITHGGKIVHPSFTKGK